MRKRILHIALAGALVALAAPASAFSITGLSVTLGATNSADDFVNTGANRRQVESTASITASSTGPVADVSGSVLSFEARYASMLAVDRESGVNSLSRTLVSEYTITFTVNNPSGGLYQLDIDTRRLGALTLANDADSGSASAVLGAVTGLLDGGADPNLALVAVGPLSGSSGNTPFNQTGTTLTIMETALVRTYTLTFSWSATANSARDEAAVRMGIAGALTGSTADDYPGVGARTLADDGHFANVLVTLIPEPPLALLALGLLPAALAFRRFAAR
jgi:hypothetical protein